MSFTLACTQFEKVQNMLKILGSASALTIFFAALSPAWSIEPAAPAEMLDAEQSIGLSIRHQLNRADKRLNDREKLEYAALSAFYDKRDNAPYWTTDNGLTKAARDIIREISQADDYGLEANKFDLPSIAASESGMTRDQRIATEKQLSLNMLKYARFAKGGRFDPRKLSRMIDRGPTLPDPIEVLDRFDAADDKAAFLRDLHPKHEQFERLRQKFLELRLKDDTQRLVHIPSGPVLKPGHLHRNVELLRQRLGVDQPKNEYGAERFNPRIYDSALEDAVRAFQNKHGLKPDGIVGPSTRRAMNANNRSRTQLILVNMERWRWLPEDMGKLHVQVNVPEFRFRVMKNGKPVHSERVVVGKLKNKTPIFSDEMERIVFHPFWNVPPSIKYKEIWPSLRRSTGVLRRHNLRVKYRGRPIDPSYVNWSYADLKQYHFYQPPGRSNVLGNMKFMFPNKHAVYMHDTSSKQHFSQNVRTYSHGCIRVQNPRKFAELLLKHDKGWGPGRIQRILAAGANHSVEFNNKVPVHITYMTAHVDDKGELRTYRDYYGHDRRISGALNGKAHLIAIEAQREVDDVRVTQRTRRKPQTLFQAIFGDTY